MTEEEIKRFIREEVRKQLADIVRQIQMTSGTRGSSYLAMEQKTLRDKEVRHEHERDR